MMSTGSDSSGATKALLLKVTRPHPSTRTWRAIDATSVLSTFTFTGLGPLIRFGDERQLLESGAGQQAHDPGYRAVIRLLVGAQIDALLEPAARIRDRLQLRHQLVDRDLGVVDEDLALDVDRHLKRLLVVVFEALGLGLRQVERHTDRQHRRRDHEDDEQHQHHVDHRRDVDLGHDGLAPTTAPAASGRTRNVHRHDRVPKLPFTLYMPSVSPARRSDATVWLKIHRRSLRAAGPAGSPRM